MVIFIATVILNTTVIGIEDKTLSTEDYVNKIRPYLKDINNLKKSDTWKIQLTIAVTFLYSKYTNEERLTHLKKWWQRNHEQW